MLIYSAYADAERALLHAGLIPAGSAAGAATAPPLAVRCRAAQLALWRLALTGSQVDLRVPPKPSPLPATRRLFDVIDPASMNIAVRLAKTLDGIHALAATARVQTCAKATKASPSETEGMAAALPRRSGFPRCLDEVQWPPASSVEQGKDWAVVGLQYEYHRPDARRRSSWLPAALLPFVEPSLAACTATLEHDALNQDWLSASLLADVELRSRRSTSAEGGVAQSAAPPTRAPLRLICGAEVSTNVKTIFARPSAHCTIGARWEGAARRSGAADGGSEWGEATPTRWSDAIWSATWRTALPRRAHTSARHGTTNSGHELLLRYDGRSLPPPLLLLPAHASSAAIGGSDDVDFNDAGALALLLSAPPRIAAALRVWSPNRSAGVGKAKAAAAPYAGADRTRERAINIDAAVVRPLSEQTTLRARVGLGLCFSSIDESSASAGAGEGAPAPGAVRNGEICAAVSHDVTTWLQVSLACAALFHAGNAAALGDESSNAESDGGWRARFGLEIAFK